MSIIKGDICMTRIIKNSRYILLKVKNITLEDIGKINSYKDKVKIKGTNFDAKNPETYYEYKIANLGNKDSISLENGESVEFVKAEVQCEYPTKKMKDEDGNLLPKGERLNYQHTPILFAKYQMNTYAIIYTFDNSELVRIRKLLGGGNISSPEYQLTTGFFEWLFYRYMSESKEIGENIVINDITEFRGNLSSNEDNNILGDSNTNVSELLITKAFLATRSPIQSLKVDINIEGHRIMFFVENKENIKLMVIKGSYIMMESLEAVDYFPMYIFFYLMPSLLQCYNEEREYFEENDKEDYLSALSKDVIREIMNLNNLSKEDL